MNRTFRFNLAQGVREATENGKHYLVVPAVMILEGVHIPMQGTRTYYPPEAIADLAAISNGAPVVVNHPVNSEGQPVSARNSIVIHRSGVGEVRNAKVEDGKAKSELWIEVSKANALIPETVARMKEGQPVEVSTGIFCVVEEATGVWNGEEYTEKVVKITALDHLAILPDAIGACSWSDGCGIRAAQSGNEHKDNTMIKRIWARMQELAAAVKANEMSMDDIYRALWTQVEGLNNASWKHWVREVFETYVVYEATTTNPNESGDLTVETKLYKRTFTKNEDGTVTLGDDAQEVVEERNYVPVANAAPPEAPKTITDHTCKCKEKANMKKDELVNKLIACERTRWQETDREFLMTQEVQTLEKFQAPDQPEKKEPEPVKEPVANAAPEQPKTVDQWLDAAPDPVKGSLKALVARDEAEKASLVKKILEVKTNKFTEADLKAMDRPTLDRLAALAAVPVVYSGSAPALPQPTGVPAMPSTAPVKK
jgi:hypothetical protein